MLDIDHFSEKQMSKSNLKNFTSLLPERLRSKFKDVSKGHAIDVLQGYRGPTHLRISGSGYSTTEEEYLGVQRIGFWYAISKHFNWAPALGSIVFGMTRFTQSIQRSSNWTYLYFDAATGEIMEKDHAIYMQSLNNKAEEYFMNSDKSLQSEKFEEAFNEAKIAFDICSDGYKHQEKFKKAMDTAQAKRATQLYKEADQFGRDKKYEEALDLYKKADKLSLDSNELRDSQTKQASMLNHIGDQLREAGSLVEAMKLLIEAQGMTNNEKVLERINDSIALTYAKEGETLFNEGKYQEAALKFEQASETTTNGHDFKFWIKRIKLELEAADIKEEGDLLFNSQKYNEAIVPYKLALRKTHIDSEKTKIIRLIEATMQKLPAQDTRDASQEQAQNMAQALDMTNEGLALMCEGNLLRTDRKFSSASIKYDEASICFEQAARINPLNIIFNSLLKLIDAYNEIQGYDKAKQLLDKAKDIFPDKSEELEDIKRKIGTMDWSPDYLKMYMTQEDNCNEPRASTSQSYPF